MQEADRQLVEADDVRKLEKRIKEEGMNVNAVDEDGYTLLHWAATYGSEECLRV